MGIVNDGGVVRITNMAISGGIEVHRDGVTIGSAQPRHARSGVDVGQLICDAHDAVRNAGGTVTNDGVMCLGGTIVVNNCTVNGEYVSGETITGYGSL